MRGVWWRREKARLKERGVWDGLSSSVESCCSLRDVLGHENTHIHTHRGTQRGLCNFLPPMHAVGSSPPLQHQQQQQKPQNPDLTPIPESPKHRWVEKHRWVSEKSCQVVIVGQMLLNANELTALLQFSRQNSQWKITRFEYYQPRSLAMALKVSSTLHDAFLSSDSHGSPAFMSVCLDQRYDNSWRFHPMWSA